MRPFALAVFVFLVLNFSTVVHKAKLTCQGAAYLIFCNDKVWPTQPDPKSFFKGKDKEQKIEKKTIMSVTIWMDTTRSLDSTLPLDSSVTKHVVTAKRTHMKSSLIPIHLFTRLNEKVEFPDFSKLFLN